MQWGDFVKSWAGKFVMLLTVLLLVAGQWGVLQTLAWATMLVDYSRAESLSAAVVKTFDGHHPCALCRTVQAGRQQEHRASLASEPFRLECTAPAVLTFIHPDASVPVMPQAQLPPPGHRDPPLTPPPLAG
jgi:hypothetical protein